MKHISDDKINCIEMFSSEWWKKVKEACWHITPNSSDETLGEWFIDFHLIWMEDNWYCIDIWNPKKTKTGESFYCAYNDCMVFYKWNLEETLLNRWAEYLLND